TRVAPSSAAATSAAAMAPSDAGRTSVERAPHSRARSIASRTEACSIAVETTWSPAPSDPSTARLFASVPPLVKTTSAGRAFTSAATSSRADSIASRARRPAACALDGFARSRPRRSATASRTSGRTRAPELWSRFIAGPSRALDGRERRRVLARRRLRFALGRLPVAQLRHLALEARDLLREPVDRPDERVWKLTMLEAQQRDAFRRVRRRFAHDATGHADDGRVRRHGGDDDRAGADPAVSADRDGSEHRRAEADHDVVLDGRVALPLGEARAAEAHALVDEDVVSDLGGLPHDDAHAVVDEDAPSDARAGVDLDPGQEARERRQEARRQPRPAQPQRVGDAMHQQRVDARVAEDDLERRARGRIPLEGDEDVLAYARPHRHGEARSSRSLGGRTARARAPVAARGPASARSGGAARGGGRRAMAATA